MAEGEAHTSGPFGVGTLGCIRMRNSMQQLRLSFFTASLHLPESHKGSGSVSGIC